MEIAGHKIGEPVFIVAEMGANHAQQYDEAVKLIHIAKDCGADAVKVQCYTPDTMCRSRNTDDTRNPDYEIYGKSFMYWAWIPDLKILADQLGIILFSSVYDKTSVDWLEKNCPMPAYKIASDELTDLDLIRYVAQIGRPMILSTGMADWYEIRDALEIVFKNGALLKCTSLYPARIEEMNLSPIREMIETWDIPIGLSDHSVNPLVPVIAVSLGACIIEAHLMSGQIETPDSAFSYDTFTFRDMVKAVRETEKALGNGEMSEREKAMRIYRRNPKTGRRGI